ncbi:MAG: HlyD family secretion protein [bacterium]
MPEDKSNEILNRDPYQFSKKFQSILYSEPKHLATMGFYLIFISALILGAWSFFSIVNKSYTLKGEITRLNPDTSIQLTSPFEFRRHSVHIGQDVKKGDILFEYYDQNKQIVNFLSPVPGRVSLKADLKQGVTYAPSTEIITIRPEDKEVAVKLYVPDNTLNKIKIGNKVVYHFSFSFGPKNKIIEGTVLTEPVFNNNQYIVEANISDPSLNFLDEQKIKLITGMPVNAEIVVGQERLLSRFLGVKP